MPFPAISIIQPMPWLIVRPDLVGAEARAAARERGEFADVENRAWEHPQRGWVLVHASKHRLAGWDYRARALFAAKRGVEVPLRDNLPYGAVVGAMRIESCGRRSPSRWFVGPVGYGLTAAVAFAEPVACDGAPQFFHLPPTGAGPGGIELHQALAAQLRAAGVARFFGLEDDKKILPAPPVVAAPGSNPNP
jgi:hypothetical protein